MNTPLSHYLTDQDLGILLALIANPLTGPSISESDRETIKEAARRLNTAEEAS